MQRQYRELSDTTKQKMSQAAKGKKRSAQHCLHLSQALKRYWAGIPNMPMSMDEFLGVDNNEEDKGNVV